MSETGERIGNAKNDAAGRGKGSLPDPAAPAHLACSVVAMNVSIATGHWVATTTYGGGIIWIIASTNGVRPVQRLHFGFKGPVLVHRQESPFES
eukprot:104419-Rhodomonas_salina.4